MWKKHPFSEPGPLEAWLGATAPSGRFEHTEKRHNPFRQKGFSHAELARCRPSARPSLVGRILAAKAGTGPTYEVTTGLHRPRFKRVRTIPSAQNHPHGCMRQRSTQPQTTLAGSSKRPKRCIVRMFEKLFLRQIQTQTVTAQYDTAPRRVGTNPIRQHGCGARTDSEVSAVGAICPPLCPQDPKRTFKRPALLVPKKTSGIVQSGNA